MFLLFALGVMPLYLRINYNAAVAGCVSPRYQTDVPGRRAGGKTKNYTIYTHVIFTVAITLRSGDWALPLALKI